MGIVRIWMAAIVCLAAAATTAAATSGCGTVDEGALGDDEPSMRTRTDELGASYANTSAYCAPTTQWGAWEQTSLATWDDDLEPVVQWTIGTTGLHCGTYNGHDPSIGRAADWRPRSREDGTRFANWLLANARQPGNPLGIWYVIWQGQIYNIERAAEGVRALADRGSFTQNHCDHVHVSYLAEGTVRFAPASAVSWPSTAVDAGVDAGIVGRLDGGRTDAAVDSAVRDGSPRVDVARSDATPTDAAGSDRAPPELTGSDAGPADAGHDDRPPRDGGVRADAASAAAMPVMGGCRVAMPGRRPYGTALVLLLGLLALGRRRRGRGSRGSPRAGAESSRVKLTRCRAPPRHRPPASDTRRRRRVGTAC